MDLKKEDELMRWDAEYTLIECENRADETNLEKNYVITQFIKEFLKKAREEGYLN